MSGGLQQGRCRGLQPRVSPPASCEAGGSGPAVQLWVTLENDFRRRIRGEAGACLALALLVARVALADDHDVAVATDDTAVLAHRLDAGVDLHCYSLFFAVFVPEGCPGPLLSSAQ